MLSKFHIPNFLKDCVTNSIKNIGKSTGKRHDDRIKQICTFIYIRGGLYLYEFLAANLDLPSAKTIQRFIDANNAKLTEGTIYAEELKKFLVERNLPLEVIIVEDGTKITEVVEYDLGQNSLMGLVAPLQISNGLPIPCYFKALTALDIKDAITTAKKSSYIQVIIAKCDVKGNFISFEKHRFKTFKFIIKVR